MKTDDKQERSVTGFSSLSTLVSDVETKSHPSEVDSNVADTPTDTGDQGATPVSADEAAPSAKNCPQPALEASSTASEATTGKWMVGVGLGIGFLLIVLTNSTRNESTTTVVAPVSRGSASVAPAPSPPTAQPVRPGRQPVQEAFNQQSAATESLEVLGQQVKFSNPKGYCTPGNSAREVELMDLARRSLGEGSRLVHAAVRCSELEDYRKGRRDMLDHWLQIQLIGPKGNFQRIEMSREPFLSGLSKSSPRVNAAELNRRLKASFESGDISLSDMKVEPIGRDGNAVYFSMRMNMIIGETSRPVTGISGITLLNSLPLSVNVYEGTGSLQSRGQLQAVQQEVMNSLLTEN